MEQAVSTYRQSVHRYKYDISTMSEMSMSIVSIDYYRYFRYEHAYYKLLQII